MQKILIVKLSALGDIIHTLPIVKGIKENWPNSVIGWLVGRNHRTVLEGHPFLDKIFIFERERWGGLDFFNRQQEIWQLVREIRRQRYDVVLDFQGLLRSACFTLLSGAKRRIGFSDSREMAFLAYTEMVQPTSPHMHAVEKNILLAERMAGPILSRDFTLPVSSRDRERAESWMGNSPYVLLVPGARWATKRWPPGHFARLVDRVHQHRRGAISVALVGSSADKFVAEQIMAQASSPGKIINLVGKTSLKELAALMEKASVVVTNDSGPMHIASAMNTRVVALFGSTDPRKTGPYGTKHIVLKTRLECSPCRKRTCEHRPSCMEGISPEDVFSAVAKILG